MTRRATTPLTANYHAPEIAFSAPYLTEMVRQEMVNRYGDKAYDDGYQVYTTVTRKLQQAAQEAVRNNVMAYDMRHGYRGPSNVLWKVGEAGLGSQTHRQRAERSAGLRSAECRRGHQRQRRGSHGDAGRRQQRFPAHGRHALGASVPLRHPAGPNAA